MTTTEIEQRIAELIRTITPTAGEVESATRFFDLGLDSMEIVELVQHVEREFGIRVPDQELVTIDRVGRMVDFVARSQ